MPFLPWPSNPRTSIGYRIPNPSMNPVDCFVIASSEFVQGPLLCFQARCCNYERAVAWRCWSKKVTRASPRPTSSSDVDPPATPSHRNGFFLLRRTRVPSRPGRHPNSPLLPLVCHNHKFRGLALLLHILWDACSYLSPTAASLSLA